MKAKVPKMYRNLWTSYVDGSKRLLDAGMTWACVDDACDVYTVGGYLTRDNKERLPSLTVSTDPVCYSEMSRGCFTDVPFHNKSFFRCI